MKVTEKLTETEFAERLEEVLDRARQGEVFAIERDGEVFAMIGPPSAGSETTLRNLAIELARMPPLDEEFEADIEAVRANQRRDTTSEWPDRRH